MVVLVGLSYVGLFFLEYALHCDRLLVVDDLAIVGRTYTTSIPAVHDCFALAEAVRRRSVDLLGWPVSHPRLLLWTTSSRLLCHRRVCRSCCSFHLSHVSEPQTRQRPCLPLSEKILCVRRQVQNMHSRNNESPMTAYYEADVVA